MKKFSEQEIKTIITLYSTENKSLQYIAKLYKVSSPVIGRLLRKHEIPIRKLNELTILLQEDQIENIKKLCDIGKSHIEIAHIYKIKSDIVLRFIKRHNIAYENPQLNKRKQEEDKIINLYQNLKWSSIAIAKELKISKKKVLRVLKKNKIKIRTMKEAKNLAPKKFSNQQIEKMIYYYTVDNLSAHEIGKIFKIEGSTVRYYLRKNNIIVRNLKEARNNYTITNNLTILNKSNISDIEKMYYKENLSVKDIANKFNIHEVTLYKFMRNNGIPTKKKKTNYILTDLDKEKIIFLYSQMELSVTDIANKIGTSRSIILKFLINKKIKLRNIKEAIDSEGYRRKIHKIYIDKSTLENLYIKQELSCVEIAFLYKTSNASVINLMKFHEIPLRSKNDIVNLVKKKKGFCGKPRSSNAQLYINNILNWTDNHIIGPYYPDMYNENFKTIIEYDGSGHALKVKMGNQSPKQFAKLEIIREEYFFQEGYKLIRIKSNKDRLPSDNIIFEMINFALEKLKIYNKIIFDIDCNFVLLQNEVLAYDFGKLNKITKKSLEKFKHC